MAITPKPGQWNARDKVPVIDNPIVWALNLPVEVARADSRRPEGVAGRQVIPLENGRGDLSEQC